MQLKDETSYRSLSEDNDFQTVDLTKEKTDSQARTFVDEIDELADNRVHPARNPFIRLALGGGVLAFLLGFGIITHLGGRNEPVAEENTEESVESVEENITTEQQLENDRLRSELALLEQQIELANMERDPITATDSSPANSTPTATSRTPETTPSQVRNRPPTRSTTTASRPVSTVPPRPQQRTVPQPQRIITRTVSTPSTPPPIATSSRSAASAPNYIPQDPNEAWLAASKAGVMGVMPVENAASVTDTNTEVAIAPAQPEYYLKGQTVSDASQDEFDVEYSDFREEYADETSVSFRGDVPGLLSTDNGQPGQIILGTEVEAVVVNPITWLDDEAQFVISTTEDVVDATGNTVIPADSLVFVQPVEVNEDNGHARLAVVGFNVNGETFPVDYRTIDIYGEGGDPLIADRYGDIGGDIARNDIEMFAIGALAGIGEELTRPDSQTISTGTFGSTIATDNGDRNILGAILAGGADQLTDRMGSRNDERLNDIRSREDIFFLDQGKKVSLYFNEEMFL